jgi:hypothetical protein
MRLEIAPDMTSAWDDRGDVLWMANTLQLAMGLLNQTATPNSLLAPAVRWIGPDGRVWVWERPPRQHILTYLDRKKSGHKIWLPWTVEVLDTTKGTLQIFARNSPLSSMEDGICSLPLPGVKADGRVPIPRLQTNGGAEVMIAAAKHAFDGATWAGTVPEDRRPPMWRKMEPLEMLAAWGKLDLLQTTATDWQLTCTFADFVKPFETMPTTSLYEIFEKAAGHRK